MRRDRILALLLLLGALGLFFYPLLLGQTFSTVAGHQSSVYPWRAYPTGFTDYPQSDQADLSYPWQAYLTRSIRAGEWPWWNPDSFGGQPIFSNGSSAMFYPPRLLAALLVSPSWAHDLLSLLHLLFGGWFMYLLLREFDAEFPGAIYGALTWMLNSFTFAWLHLDVVAPVFMFLPLTVFCVLRAARTRSWSWTASAAVSLGALLCAGHLPFMGITFLVPGVYAVWLGVTAARHHLARHDVRTAALEFLRPWVTMALAAGVAAIVLLPTLHTIGESQRQVLPYEAFLRMPLQDLGSLFHPPALPVSQASMHRMAFSGTATVLLALVGALLPGAGAWFARILAAIVVLTVLDMGLLRLVYWLLPEISAIRPLGRLLFLLNFAVALLAGLGLDAIWRWALNPRLPAWIPGLDKFQDKFREWCVRSRERLAGSAVLAAAALCLFTTIELISYGRVINPPFHPRSPAYLYPVTPLITALSAPSPGRAPERVLPITPTSTDAWRPPTLFAAEPLVFGIEAITGYDSVVPRWALLTLRMLRGEPLDRLISVPFSGAFAPWVYVRDTRFDLLARAGVTTVTGSPDIAGDPYWCPLACAHLQPAYSGPDGRTFRVRDSNPGPWFAYKSRVVPTEADAFRLLADTSFDYRGHVVLHGNDAPEPIREELGSGQIHSVLKSNNRMVVTGSSSHAGWLVVPDTFDKGWTAIVNGKAARLLRANYAFRAIPVPAGPLQVEMRYVPEGFVAGALLTGLTVASCALLILASWRGTRARERRRPRDSPDLGALEHKPP